MKTLHYLSIFLFLITACLSAFAVDKDGYEMDDYKEQATLIDVADTENQQHNFHQAADQDWFKFFAQKDQPTPYSIEVKNQQSKADAVIEVFDSQNTLIASVDDAIAGEGEYEILELKFPSDGIYYFRITQHDSSVYGENTDYQVRLYHPVMQFKGKVITRVLDAVTGQPVTSPTVTSSSADRTTYLGSRTGKVIMSHPAGNVSLTFSADKYQSQIMENVIIDELATTRLDFIYLQPLVNLAQAQTTSDNTAPSKPETIPVTTVSTGNSPTLVEYKVENGVSALRLPIVYVHNISGSLYNVKAVLSRLEENQQPGKMIFTLTELYTLDITEQDENYPAFISGTGILYIPLTMIGETAYSHVSLQLIQGTSPMQFELINYKL
ncbi:MAG: carboxypeptidase-like regulatory domain-containing protein [Pseudomonadota bacterium]